MNATIEIDEDGWLDIALLMECQHCGTVAIHEPFDDDEGVTQIKRFLQGRASRLLAFHERECAEKTSLLEQ